VERKWRINKGGAIYIAATVVVCVVAAITVSPIPIALAIFLLLGLIIQVSGTGGRGGVSGAPTAGDWHYPDDYDGD
jgi:hypothetical protein